MPPPTALDSSACKAAINAMAASVSKAVAADGVTVNAVSPGTLHSSTLDAPFRDVANELGLRSKDAPWEEVERQVLSLFAHVPVSRVGQSEEIAAAMTFPASPLAGNITGTNLRIEDGLSSAL